MSLIDYNNVPDETAGRLAKLRTAMVDLTGDDVIAFAQDGSGLKGVDIHPPREPRVESGASKFAKDFFNASVDMNYYLSAKNEHIQKFDQDADFRKAVALNVLQTLNEGQPETVENFWKARDVALERMKDDVFSTRDEEFVSKTSVSYICDDYETLSLN